MSGEVLTVAEMAAADRLAEASGVPSLTLMDNAGRAVADAVTRTAPDVAVLVFCGPGNNGGDGFAAARHLRHRGYPVLVQLLAAAAELMGDAARMAQQWDGPIASASGDLPSHELLIVDALFGAGLSRPLEGVAADLVRAVNRRGVPVIAVDVPSGLHGDLGRPIDGIDGLCVRATETVTFFRMKPAHLLMPGRDLCGHLSVADIGIPDLVLGEIAPELFANGPAFWRPHLPLPTVDGHKYARGHTVVVSEAMHATGAARTRGAWSASGRFRARYRCQSPGCGRSERVQLTAIMVKPIDGPKGLSALLADKRFNAVQQAWVRPGRRHARSGRGGSRERRRCGSGRGCAAHPFPTIPGFFSGSCTVAAC